MSTSVDMASKSAIRAALARAAYARGEVRIADPCITDCDWLVATQRGLFGVSDAGVTRVLHGWFFGICRHADQLYVYENCGYRERTVELGRILRFDMADGMLRNPVVLVSGLHTNCHQIAIFDEILHVVDTNNQAIRRYTLEGATIDVQRPFPPATVADTSGAYVHVNSIAKIDGRVGLVLHNGVVEPKKQSELAWLDAEWNVVERVPLDGHMCHDIVVDGEGWLWHSSSESGAITRSDGLRVQVTDGMMTRGIAFARGRMAVGICAFGPRQTRGDLHGRVVLLNEAHRIVGGVDVPSGPTAILALG